MKKIKFLWKVIFLFSAYYANETFGLVNIEAMQFGLPIIRVQGAISDIVNNNVNGFIIREKSHELKIKLNY